MLVLSIRFLFPVITIKSLTTIRVFVLLLLVEGKNHHFNLNKFIPASRFKNILLSYYRPIRDDITKPFPVFIRKFTGSD